MAACLLAPLAARSGDGPAIGIDNFTFAPGTLTIAPGTEVTWTNHDDIPHSIVVTGTSIRSKALDTDQTFAWRFDQAGTFTYICGLHPQMHGQIVVK
jgi:plastocyanin